MSERVGTEALGLARDFIRRIRREQDAHAEFLHALWAPIMEHCARKGRLRVDDWWTLRYRWERQAPATFRLVFAANVKGKRGTIRELRLFDFRQRREGDPSWQGEELAIAIAQYEAEADNRGTRNKDPVVIATFSLHALGRRIERGRKCDDDALIDDIGAVVRVYNEKPVGYSFELVSPEHHEGSGWRGHVAEMRIGNPAMTGKVVRVRTWI